MAGLKTRAGPAWMAALLVSLIMIPGNISQAAVTIDFDQETGPSPAWYGTNTFFTDQTQVMFRHLWTESSQKVIRIHLFQQMLEPVNDNEDPHTINWEGFRFGYAFPWQGSWTVTFDEWVGSLRDSGVILMPNFVYLAGWLSANEDEGLVSTYPPADLDEYYEYVYAVLYHMVYDLNYPPDRIVVEPMNEPDLGCGVDPGVHCFWNNWVMSDLVDVVVTTVQAAHDVDENIRAVGLSECCGTDLTRQFMDHYNGSAYLDGLTYHTYVDSDFSAAITRANTLKPYGLPVLINEYGSFSHLSNGIEGALWHSYALDQLWRNDINPIQYPFTEFTGNSEPYNSMGLLLDWTGSWTPKPAYFVYTNFYRHMGETEKLNLSVSENLLVLAGKKGLTGNRDRAVIFVTNRSGTAQGNVRFRIRNFSADRARICIYDNTAGIYPVEDFVSEGSPITFSTPVGSTATLTITATGPAAAPLVQSFQAYDGEREVHIKWRTEAEPYLLGFILFRSDREEGPYARIHPTLILNRGSTFYGESYAFVDREVTPGQTCWYKLETRVSQGKNARFGPVSATGLRGMMHELLPADSGRRFYPHGY